MDIEQLKKEWKQYNRKLEVSQRLNEHVIQSMIRERSRSRVAKIRRESTRYLILMILNLVLLAGIFAGNPFDFTYTVQYIPYAILAVGILLAIGSLMKTFKLFNVNPNDVDLGTFCRIRLMDMRKTVKLKPGSVSLSCRVEP